MNYIEKIIRFNELKYKALLKKSQKSKGYFIQRDFDHIEKMDKVIAKIVWEKLIFNIVENNFYGISRQTCTFCIHHDIFNKFCKTREWGKNHGICKSKNGDFQKLQMVFKNENIETITSEEYKRIVRKIKEIK